MSSILRCTSCGAQHTVQPAAAEPPRCPDCGALVPWLVAALVETFDEEAGISRPLPVPVLVDFWAAWCTPCRFVTPLVARAARDHAGRLKVVKVNADRVPEVADRYRLLSLPTLSLLVNGEEVDRVTGMIPPPAFEEFLAPYLAPAPAAPPASR